jgi:hypothetical protein
MTAQHGLLFRAMEQSGNKIQNIVTTVKSKGTGWTCMSGETVLLTPNYEKEIFEIVYLKNEVMKGN